MTKKQSEVSSASLDISMNHENYSTLLQAFLMTHDEYFYIFNDISIFFFIKRIFAFSLSLSETKIGFSFFPIVPNKNNTNSLCWLPRLWHFISAFSCLRSHSHISCVCRHFIVSVWSVWRRIRRTIIVVLRHHRFIVGLYRRVSSFTFAWSVVLSLIFLVLSCNLWLFFWLGMIMYI